MQILGNDEELVDDLVDEEALKKEEESLTEDQLQVLCLMDHPLSKSLYLFLHYPGQTSNCEKSQKCRERAIRETRISGSSFYLH